MAAEKGAPIAIRNPWRRKRLVILISVGLLLIGAAWTYRRFWITVPMGQGPAGPAVSEDVFASPWTDREVLFLGVGDSITAGACASRGHSYFEMLVANPPDDPPEMRGKCLSAVLPNMKVKNISVSATTSPEHLDDLQKFEKQPENVLGIVVMTTGGNDIIHDYGEGPPEEAAMYGATRAQARPWVRNFEKRLETMIDLLEEKFPGGVHIFLADIYDFTDGVGDITRCGLPAWPDGLDVHAAYNDVIHACAERRESVHLVSIYEEFLGHGIHCRQPWNRHYRKDDPHFWYAEILEDPNDRGYDAIRRLMLNEMVKVLPEPPE